MKKTYYTLEVICHKNNENDKKLVCENGNFLLRDSINRPFIMESGILSNIEKNKVDLLNLKNVSKLSLPSNIDSFSLVLFKKTKYTSNTCNIIVTENEKEILKIYDNLLEYSDNGILMNRSEYDEVLNNIAYKINSIIRKKAINELKELKTIAERKLGEIDNYNFESNLDSRIKELNLVL